jgi:hypothetical protein
MIYINTVQTNKPMVEIKTERDFEFFKTYKPQRFEYPANEEQEKAIKLYKMKIIIAGQMTGDLKRNNENLFSRSLLFVDFDDIHETEAAFLSKVQDKLKGINYCLYPTLRYRADYIRYRLALELNRPVNAGEYEKLLFGICHELGVNFTFDSSNKTWSQGQGAPVITQHSEHVSLIYHDNGEPIPTDAFLFKISNSKEYKNQIKQQHAFKKGNSSYNRSSGGQKYTGLLLQVLFNGAAPDARNNWWREMVDKMLAVDTPLETIQLVMETINFNEQITADPLELDELEKIYLSRVNNHAKKGGRLF